MVSLARQWEERIQSSYRERLCDRLRYDGEPFNVPRFSGTVSLAQVHFSRGRRSSYPLVDDVSSRRLFLL